MSDVNNKTNAWITEVKKKIKKREMHKNIKRKGCRDQDSNLGYCGHNAGS